MLVAAAAEIPLSHRTLADLADRLRAHRRQRIDVRPFP
jgi:hypothetical protein